MSNTRLGCRICAMMQISLIANYLDNFWLSDQVMQAFHSHLLTSKFSLHNKAPGTSTKKLLHVEGDFISWDFPEITLVGLLRLQLLRVPLDLSTECQYFMFEVIIFSLYESITVTKKPELATLRNSSMQYSFIVPVHLPQHNYVRLPLVD